jgi:serine/threonine protein kinase
VRETAPAELVELLTTLGLASADQVRGVRGRVRRLTRDLPRFDSVWLDALVQARVVTRFQAAEINARRGAGLQVGPFVLCQPVGRPGYGKTYRARDIITREEVRLTVVRVGTAQRGSMLSQLEAHIRSSTEIIAPIDEPGIVSHNRCGMEGDCVWAASPWIEGQPAAPWMAYHGRFPPDAVLEIARQMLTGLQAWEDAGLLHSDLGANQLLIDDEGTVRVTGGGLRGTVRPNEAIDEGDERELPADVFDYLAPERFERSAPATTASDLFAYGCLLWHLLTGRPPLPGATRGAKMHSALKGRIPDVRSLAPETPPRLASLIDTCTRLKRAERPESFATLAAELGPSTRRGKILLAQCIQRTGRAPARLIDTVQSSRRSPDAALWVAAVVGCLLVLAVATWPQWGPKLPFDDLAAAMTGPQKPHKAAANSGEPQGTQQKAPQPIATESFGAPKAATSQTRPASTPPFATQQATYTQPVAPMSDASETSLGNGTVLATKIVLRPGQIVRGGADGRRTRVVVPAGGWQIRVENLRFENIDFVVDSGGAAAKEKSQALLLLQALQAEFRGCSFAAAGDATAGMAAISWSLPSSATANDEQLPPIGKLRFNDCIFQDVAAAIDSHVPGSAALDWANSLHLGPGPLVRLHRWPLADESLTLGLNRCTLRGAQGLIEMVANPETSGLTAAGRVMVRAEGCAFAPMAGGGLMLFAGEKPSPKLLHAIEWSGQGSVLSRESALLVWKNGARGEALPEEGIQVAGLVRSEIEFAGVPRAGAAANQAVRWLVPLQSPDPPGIGELRFGNAIDPNSRGRR